MALRHRLSVIAIVLLASSARAQPALSLEAQLRLRAVTDADFARRELYTWTSREQARRIVRERRLLWARAGDGAVVSPYQHALERAALRDGEDGRLARTILESPALAMRRYTWSTPYGTVIGRGARSYGPALVQLTLRQQFWIARFAPEEPRAFRVVDERGRDVPLREVLACPTRLAGVYHVRRRARGGAFREIVVHQEALVERFELGTPELERRVRADAAVLSRMARWQARQARAPASLAPFWRTSPQGLLPAFAATMPFDTPRHRPSAATLGALRRALGRWRGPRFARTTQRPAIRCPEDGSEAHEQN